MVVHQLRLRPRRQDVVDGAPDGRLIQQPAVTARSTELDHRPALGLHVLGVAAVVDVRVDAGGAQSVAQIQRVHPDCVTAGEGRNDLVDPHGRAVYRRRPAPRLRLPMHQSAQVAPLALVGSCWAEPLSRAPARHAGARPRRSARSSSRSPSWCPPPCSASHLPPRRPPSNAPDRASVPAEITPRGARPAGRRHQRPHRHDRERRARRHRRRLGREVSAPGVRQRRRRCCSTRPPGTVGGRDRVQGAPGPGAARWPTNQTIPSHRPSVAGC